jgi:hypothetical protein
MANLITDGFDWFPSRSTSRARAAVGGQRLVIDGNSSKHYGRCVTGRFNFGKAMFSTPPTGTRQCRLGAAPLGAINRGSISGRMHLSGSAGNTDKAGTRSASMDAESDGNLPLSICARMDVRVKVKRGHRMFAQSGLTCSPDPFMGCFQEDEWFFPRDPFCRWPLRRLRRSPD